MNKIIFLTVVWMGTASAGEVPAIESPPILSKRNIRLTAKERKAARLAKGWIGKKTMPYMVEEGKIVYFFGSTLPSIVCSPLKLCDIELEPGEIVRNLHLGDVARWKAKPALSGPKNSPGTITHIIVSPLDVGISTSMLVTTDRRTYHFKLVSRRKDYMPRVGFAYATDIEQGWQEYYASQKVKAERSTFPKTRENINKLFFEYEISGDNPSWRPVRVYNNGVKTIIQMPKEMKQTEAPALLVIGEDSEKQMVNFRLKGDRFIVDQIFKEAILIAGVGGDQTKVTITKKGSKNAKKHRNTYHDLAH